jgi:hypothetical protein
LELVYHPLFLLLGIALAGLAVFGAVAMGPRGGRGLRLTLAMTSFVAVLGCALWIITYLAFIDQRRSIETRLSELRTQALSVGSVLACLERAGELLGTACAQTLFAAPETLAAADFYTATRLDVLKSAARYGGPRTPQFDDAIAALERSLQQDPLGLTANTLMLREGCTAARCDVIALFRDPARLWDNIRQKTYDANIVRYASGWRAPVAAASLAAASPVAASPAAAPPPAAAPTAAPAATVAAPLTTTPSGETRAPIPDKYALPSADSIPPVSIMNDEPADRSASAAAQSKDRPKGTVRQPVASGPEPSPASPQSTPAASPPATAEKQPAVRREKARPNAPLSIVPTQ